MRRTLTLARLHGKQRASRHSARRREGAHAYDANQLNQYSSIGETGETPFESEFDLDVNQTRLKTSTGTWSVEYNAMNPAHAAIPSCMDRQAARLDAHLSCYYECGFYLKTNESWGLSLDAMWVGVAVVLPGAAASSLKYFANEAAKAGANEIQGIEGSSKPYNGAANLAPW